MDKRNIERLKNAIKRTKEWIENPASMYADDEEYSHNFYKVELNSEQVLIMAQWFSSNDNERTFFMYDIKNKTIRDVTEIEDEVYRGYDDEFFIVENEDNYIMSRDDD